jgi:hypothetical protein
MYIRAPVSVTVSMKSAASSASAWERRKAAQVVAGAVGRGIHPGLAQDLPYRRWGDRDPEGEQFAMHSPISPAGVLACQAQDQGPDRPQRAGSAAAVGPGHHCVAAGDQVAVPPEDRVGPDQQPQAPQGRPRQRVQQRGQPRPIRRCEPDLLPGELVLQHRELVAQRQDLDVLVAVAARQHSQQRERVRDAQIRQPNQHESASSLSDRRRRTWRTPTNRAKIGATGRNTLPPARTH